LHRATELRLSHAVEEMLEDSLGQGRVRAEAAVTMNYERVNETSETYNPDQQVVRSTQTSTDKSNSTEGEKSVSVANNLPNADAAATQNGTQEQKQDETTNYEIGKTVRTLVRGQPEIARISLAVMVDGTMQPGRDGKPVWTARSTDDLARIKRLVESAIGYDAKRGDTVEVESMRFAVGDETADAAPSGLLSLGLEKADFIDLAQSGILAVVVLLALIFVLRPMAVRLSAIAPQSMLGGGDALLVSPDGVSISLPGSAMSSSTAMITAGQAMLADESMITMQNIEGQLRASAMKKLTDLVEQHPEASLSIMRSWMTTDQT
jgi:flagellar M-ring protein FliF